VQSQPRRRSCGIPFRSTPRNSASATLQNQLLLAECNRQKKLHGGLQGATRGWHLKQRRKINCSLQIAVAEKICTVGCEVLREKLGSGAKPATPPTPQLRTSAPQNQLHLAECTCRKSGGRRCATWGWQLKYKSCT